MNEQGEDDYMSASFLVENESRTSTKRKSQPSQPTTTSKKSRTEQRLKTQQDRLAHGLSAPIDQTNKGFQLLQKMGFKQGPGLGLAKAGLAEPLKVFIKSGKSGLGLEEEKERKAEEQFHQRVKFTEELQQDFRARAKTRFEQRKTYSQLKKMTDACRQLDEAKQIQDNPLLFKSPEDGAEEDDSEAFQEDPVVLLERLEDYLRDEHAYCFFCGCSFESQEKLGQECPGKGEMAQQVLPLTIPALVLA
eukprot:TRINITY_DN10978_c0_g1_i2.p1 TRINITY_DN10978_c0_g1~~TRINITY_DN10978_c0_g1_i2.p1  ORF type:complete len:248 (-),score=55.38 TRINITY_DN10978_c0_g1_i2:10-753(-)